MKRTAWVLGSMVVLCGAFLPLADGALAAGTVQVAAPQAAENALNPVITVRDGVVKVSDIFSGPIPRGDRAVLAAPSPGERSVLDADLLIRIARAYGLDWKPASREIKAVVKRESRTLTQAEIIADVRAALEAEGAPKNAEILPSTSSLSLALPADAVPTVEVGQVVYDPRAKRFSAMVDITATADGRVVFTRQMPIGGRIYPTEPVLVLTTSINRGEVIRAGDVTVANLRSDTVRDGAVTDAFAVVGKQARRTIREGEPILANQIQTPVLVRRGDEVVVFYALKTMNLTAKGKALDAGGQGEHIRVLNPKSNRVLTAKVVQANQVVVDVATQTAQR
jgi:flagella basal body P-ring formation protein FlgA